MYTMLRPRPDAKAFPDDRGMSSTVQHVFHGGEKMVLDVGARDRFIKVTRISLTRCRLQVSNNLAEVARACITAKYTTWMRAVIQVLPLGIYATHVSVIF